MALIAGIEDDDREKNGEDPLVGNGEGQHAPRRTLLHAMLQEGAVLAERAHAGPRTATPAAPHAMARHAHRERLPSGARRRGTIANCHFVKLSAAALWPTARSTVPHRRGVLHRLTRARAVWT